MTSTMVRPSIDRSPVDVSEERMQYWESLIGTGRFPGTPGETVIYPQHWPKDRPMEPWFQKLIDEHPEWVHRDDED